VELTGPLTGHHLVVDDDAITFGVLEDFQSNQVSAVLDALVNVIIGSDLPHGHTREGLRKLRVKEATEVVDKAFSGSTLGNAS